MGVSGCGALGVFFGCFRGILGIFRFSVTLLREFCWFLVDFGDFRLFWGFLDFWGFGRSLLGLRRFGNFVVLWYGGYSEFFYGLSWVLWVFLDFVAFLCFDMLGLIGFGGCVCLLVWVVRFVYVC